MAGVERDLVHAFYAYAQTGGNLVEAFHDPDYVHRGNAAFAHFAHPDFEFVLVRGEGGEEGRYLGVDGFWAGMRDWLGSWRIYEVELEEVVERGSRILALEVERGRSSGGDVPLVHRGAVLWEFADGKVRRITTYLQRDQAFRGLEAERP